MLRKSGKNRENYQQNRGRFPGRFIKNNEYSNSPLITSVYNNC